MGYTIQSFTTSQQAAHLNAVKDALEATGYFDSVVFTGTYVVTAYINGVARFVVDNSNWISYIAYLPDGTTSISVHLESYTKSYIGISGKNIIFSHDHTGGCACVGGTTDNEPEAFMAICNSTGIYNTLCKSSGTTWVATQKSNSSNSWSTLAQLLAYSNTSTVKNANNMFRYVDKQSNITVGPIYPILIGELNYITDGYFAIKVEDE